MGEGCAVSKMCWHVQWSAPPTVGRNPWCVDGIGDGTMQYEVGCGARAGVGARWQGARLLMVTHELLGRAKQLRHHRHKLVERATDALPHPAAATSAATPAATSAVAEFVAAFVET